MRKINQERQGEFVDDIKSVIQACRCCWLGHGRARGPVDKPENGVGGAAVLERDGVTHFVAYVDVHFVSHAQGQVHGLLPAGLRAHDHAMLVLGRQAELRAPLRDLKENKPLSTY